jgi:two-component system, cell cycle sensor histidine kinase and response regulator CckA
LNSPISHVLLVDDDDLARKLIHRVLVRMQLEVQACSSAAQARAWAAEGHAIALLITDINLQDESGGALGRALRERVPELPILYISGYPSSNEEEEPSTDFLGKPFTPDELRVAVSRMLSSGAR